MARKQRRLRATLQRVRCGASQPRASRRAWTRRSGRQARGAHWLATRGAHLRVHAPPAPWAAGRQRRTTPARRTWPAPRGLPRPRRFAAAAAPARPAPWPGAAAPAARAAAARAARQPPWARYAARARASLPASFQQPRARRRTARRVWRLTWHSLSSGPACAKGSSAPPAARCAPLFFAHLRSPPQWRSRPPACCVPRRLWATARRWRRALRRAPPLLAVWLWPRPNPPRPRPHRPCLPRQCLTRIRHLPSSAGRPADCCARRRCVGWFWALRGATRSAARALRARGAEPGAGPSPCTPARWPGPPCTA